MITEASGLIHLADVPDSHRLLSFERISIYAINLIP